MEPGHVVVVAQVDRRAVGSKMGKEEMVVHGGGSCPVDLVGHGRRGRGKRPHVVVDHGVGNGSIHIVGDGEVVEPLIVVNHHPSKVVSGPDGKIGEFNITGC